MATTARKSPDAGKPKVGDLRCSSCVWIDKLGEDFICRFNPPKGQVVVVGKAARNVTAWGIVIPDRDYCAHHGSIKGDHV